MWITISFGVALFLYKMGATNEIALTAQGVMAALTNVYEFFVIYTDHSIILGPYWSLSLEEQFYIIFPFFLVFVPGSKNRLLFLALSLAALNLVPPNVRAFFKPEAIILGVMWYEIWKRIDFSFGKIDKLPALAATLFLTLLLMAADPFLNWMPLGLFILIMPSISLVMVALASLEIGFVPSIPSLSKFLDWAGTRSYALYLSNTSIFALAKYIGEVWFRNYGAHEVAIRTTAGIAGLLVAVGAAEITYRFIEEPLRKKGKNYAESLTAKKALQTF